jgi:hypothetical protein
MPSHRRVRRMSGLIARYLANPDLLRRVLDPRSEQGRRWKSCLPFLSATLLGLACGCQGLGEVEDMTADMFKSVRKLVGIPSRIPDTTLRDFLIKLDHEQISNLLYVIGYDAWRRRALHQVGDFPWAILSMDGKYPVIRDTNPSAYLQVQHEEDGEAAFGMLRTCTATLITAAGRPILGAVPVPGDTNEKGAFQKAFGDMVRIYGRLFGMVMYDAGATSKPNADAVFKAGKHYFFQVADPRWVMYQTLELLLADKPVVATDDEIISSHEHIVRMLSLVELRPTRKNLTAWKHTRTALKVVNEHYKDGVLKSTLTRYFITSAERGALPPDQWLKLVVMRWGVETSHQILDKAFAEDDRPWITSDAQGALAVMLLRRVAYTIMTLYRSVTQRSEDNRETPFRKLLGWVRDALKWPNATELEGLRTRSFAVPPALA